MNIWKHGILGLLLSLLASSAMAAEDFKYVMCRNNSIVRTIRAEWSKASDSCSTTYTKNGIDRQIATGKFFGSCVGFLDNVQVNLEKAGWNCKDISAAKIHGNKVKNKNVDTQ